MLRTLGLMILFCMACRAQDTSNFPDFEGVRDFKAPHETGFEGYITYRVSSDTTLMPELHLHKQPASEIHRAPGELLGVLSQTTTVSCETGEGRPPRVLTNAREIDRFLRSLSNFSRTRQVRANLRRFEDSTTRSRTYIVLDDIHFRVLCKESGSYQLKAVPDATPPTPSLETNDQREPGPIEEYGFNARHQPQPNRRAENLVPAPTAVSVGFRFYIIMRSIHPLALQVYEGIYVYT